MLYLLAGILLLGYLLTFVAFAVLRIATGVSIQRLGPSGLRRISFSLRQGIRVDIRGVGLSIHRPTFAHPTWCSVVITELVVTVDLQALGDRAPKQHHAPFDQANGTASKPRSPLERSHSDHEDEEGHGRLWRQLTDVKEKIKQLHSKINWVKLADLLATAATVEVVGVGSVRLDRVTLSVDTRSKTVDRSRLFQHHKTEGEVQAPAEWKCLIRSVLFTPEGRDSTEVLDYVTLNIHGMLHNRLQGLRDASIALKLGRLNVPYDDIEHARKCADLIRGVYASSHDDDGHNNLSLVDAVEELKKPASREARIVRAVSDSRAFVASILRGIQEVQFAVGFFGLSRRIEVNALSGREVYFNLAMKEVGLDVLRLDPKSAAHRMYFETKDVAHQALLTAIAISAGVDDGCDHPERIVYIPMVTATVRTTVPSRTIHYSREHGAKERNTNIFYANFVCTSPSIDLDQKHMPLVREILKAQSSSPRQGKHSDRIRLIPQLLPKAHIKLAIQEPVIRISLPPMDKSNAIEDDFDLLICSVSSIVFELESSHAAQVGILYSLASQYRHTRHHLYYQTASDERHDLLQSDTLEVQIDVSAIPDAVVSINAQFRTFTLFLVRPDICRGLRQIVDSTRNGVLSRKEHDHKSGGNFLRRSPAWLQTCKIEGSDFSLELAGVDEQVSKDSRGLAIHLESWTTEYKAGSDDHVEHSLRRSSIGSIIASKDKSSHLSPRKRYRSVADGRRLTVHLHNLEGFIIDSVAQSEPDIFLSIPRFEVAFSTSTDANGPIFHINSHTKSMLLYYSLYNHYAMGVAAMVVKRTFLDREEEPLRSVPISRRSSSVKSSDFSMNVQDPGETAIKEITIVDIKANLVQIIARMPADPPMMLHVFGLDAGRHRWAIPFLRSRITRLYVRAPRTEAAWSRIVSVKALRLDIRDLKRKVGKQIITEKSFDAVADAIRIGVPHGLVVHSIFDNITNVVKTTKQMMHHFITGTNEYVLIKEPAVPKQVPRLTLRTNLLVLDIEDGSFEWKLGAIYRTGLLEQKQRLAREDAFTLKAKRLARCGQRGSSRIRAHSAHLDDRSRSYTKSGEVGKHRSRSTQPRGRRSPQNARRDIKRRMRYETEGKCGISDASQLSVEQAREKLLLLNAQSWKLRIDRVLSFQSHAIREMRSMMWGTDEVHEESENQEPTLSISQRPGLMVVGITDLALTVDKPSFPIEQYSRFLHDVGKGMPYDMKYGMLIPMSLHITMGELRFQLRDYPLPLLHVPPLANGQSPRLPALSMKTDFVMAEEFRDFESQRHARVLVVPPEKMSGGDGKGFAIDVRRAITPVKTYSDMKFEINTSNSTKITWGKSYQPAIQDAMQVIEGFTKPPVDPSDRVGFWDKIRLSFHSRVNVAWKGDGDVHLILKGTRDPYSVTGNGAGLVMVWRNNVQWNVAQSKDPRQFMTVDASDYILAVPDFNNYARRSQETDEGVDGDGTSSTSSSLRRDPMFKKVIMKLSGNVRWLAGLVFERDTADGKRLFTFKHHYDIVLKHPDFAKAPPGEEYDAYRGLRSHHIHLSIAVSAPHDRDWSVSNLKPSANYNTVHLTPRFFSHFFSWWSMFSGTMSLPVRQGPLWGITQKKSKKFGRHIATIKYNLLLSPLFISHVYKHKDAEDYQATAVSATGLKMKLDSFMLDLHQRREQFNIKNDEATVTKKTSSMKINQAQLDFISADLRALSATIAGTSAEDIDRADDETLASLHAQIPAVDMSKFEIPDNDFTWIDMDDFVELDWILPAENDPVTKILPLGYAPRFTYFRQTDHHGIIAGDPSRTSPFGDEPTHYCVMSIKNDPRRVQAELIEQRLQTLREQRTQNERAIGEQELKVVQHVDMGDRTGRLKLESKLETLKEHGDHLQNKRDLLESMLETLAQKLARGDQSAMPDLETSEEFFEAEEDAQGLDDGLEYMDSAPLADHTSDFNNRFIVHNAQIKWNNALRNIILRYAHQISQRRGFVYYMSQRAVKFIMDVIEERQKAEDVAATTQKKSQKPQMGATSQDVDDEQTLQDRIDQLLQDGRDFVSAEDSFTEKPANGQALANAASEDISSHFVPLNIYHFRLIAPQIQLQSEKNPKSAVLVTSKGMQLKVVEIMDKDNVNDDVSGLVQRRFNAAADSLQMYVTSTKTFSKEFFHMYSANLYGAKAGTHWPPWVPMEIMFDYQANPYGFSRVVHRTSASLRYDQYNGLRLKYNDNISGEDSSQAQTSEEDAEQMDHVWLEFPHFRAICDSMQYYAMYIIVMDLLLYSEPLEKTRTERLEKIMLASDFSDLTGAPEMVHMLQERIRQLEEIKLHFQVNEKYLDRQGWKDRIVVDQDLASCEDELFFMMKAITTSQQRVEDRREDQAATPMVRLSMSAKEIAWHLIRDKDESLVEFQLQNASFDRTDNNDGSNYNVVEISRMNGFNLLPDALYPEIIAPFADAERGGRELGNSTKMLRVNWLMLEAIAGIPVVDYFEIDLVPLKMQVEREIAKKVFEYVFPGVGGNAFESGSGSGQSPFMVKNMLPPPEEDIELGEKTDDTETDAPLAAVETPGLDHVDDAAGGPGSLERRLKPTTGIQKQRKSRLENRGLGISGANHGIPGLHIFQHSDRPKPNPSLPPRSAASRRALASTNNPVMSRTPSEGSLSTMRSTIKGGDSEKGSSRRFPIHRSHSTDKMKKDAERSDDLTQMMNRASNYMTLAFVKIPSMVLCLSYKGQGKRNIEDVHDLVFRMPTLEYRNKTWSNLDLALQLKKDVIRALISHAGAIVGNKFTQFKPSRQQQSRLREIANMSAFMSQTGNSSAAASETSSMVDFALTEPNGRASTASARPSTLAKSVSLRSTPASSVHDLQLRDHSEPPARLAGDHANGVAQRIDASPPQVRTVRTSPDGTDAGSSGSTRARATSIGRHLSGFGERLRQRQTQQSSDINPAVDEAEDSRRKSRLLLGGQKLLRTLRDQ